MEETTENKIINHFYKRKLNHKTSQYGQPAFLSLWPVYFARHFNSSNIKPTGIRSLAVGKDVI